MKKGLTVILLSFFVKALYPQTLVHSQNQVSYKSGMNDSYSMYIYEGVFKSTLRDIADTAAVLQKAMDLPEFQSYFPKNINGSYKGLSVMQYPVSFSSNILISKFGEKVAFLTRPEIQLHRTEAFFIVKTFLIKEESAIVELHYYNTLSNKGINAHLSLQKVDVEWKVVTSEFIPDK